MKKTNSTILIIDDQEDILFSLKMVLKKHFESVITTENPRKVIQILAENTIDVVLLDMNYRIGYEDGKEGVYYLKEIKNLSPSTEIILMTAFGKVETAVEGIKLGAFDYLLKPFDNDKLVEITKNAVLKSRKNEKPAGNKVIEKKYFKGNSILIQKAYSLADKVAKTDANVLILGENGTGKYVMAKHIHDHSNRKNSSFIHVDLGALNENLFESELFGYAKGAFTDAKQDTVGRFESANGGTIFLDEIGNLPLNLQAKILQVIQNKTITRLGESKARNIDVRIITATNVNLKEEVENKNFREDLFYRIKVMEIEIPALRNCKEDILNLAYFQLNNLKNTYGIEQIDFTEKAKNQLINHAWKGNIRELENKIERAVIVCDGDLISEADLDLEFLDLFENENSTNLDEIEKNTIQKALIKHQFNISKTADELGLSRASLYRRMEKYKISEL